MEQQNAATRVRRRHAQPKSELAVKKDRHVFVRPTANTHNPGYMSPDLEAHIDAPVREHLFNVSQAEHEAEVEPGCALTYGR